MSKLTREINACMSQLNSDAETLTARFCFPGDFIGFKGHFPGKPILPGVCKIQAILCMLQEGTRKTPRLREIVSAKFFTPVTSNEELAFSIRQFPEGSDTVLIKALVTHKDKKIADIHLRVAFEPQER